MTLQQIIDIIKGRCKRSRDSTLDDIIISEAQLVQERMERGGVSPSPGQSGGLTPWFLQRDSFADGYIPTTTIGQDWMDLEWNFLRFNEEVEHPVWFREDENDSWHKLEALDYTIARERYCDETTLKTYWLTTAERLYFAPTPQKAYQIRYFYAARTTAVSLKEQNWWLARAPDLLLAETGMIIAGQYLDLPKVVEMFAGESQRARVRLLTEHQARMESSMMRQMGED